jgi:hypothetical protein
MVSFYRIALTLLAFATPVVAAEELRLSERCVVSFATRERAIAAITADDRFTQNLSKFDLQARMRTEREVTLADWQEFVAGEVRDWNDDDRRRLATAIESLRERLVRFTVPLPDAIHLATTSGNEEGHAAYCRGSCIVLPAKVLKNSKSDLESLLIHELFHVISNQHPELRKELYAIVGFQPCAEIAIHPSLKDRRITNPDAPAIDCLIELKDRDRVYRAAPVLYSSAEKFDAGDEKKTLFSYLVFRLMVVVPDGRHWKAADKEGRAVVIDPKGAPDFQERIGRNTNYIVHPEEILADNFVHLVLGREKLPTPRIVEELKRVLEQ